MQLCHCACISAIKTLFKYNLKEIIHNYLIKQYLKFMKRSGLKNVLLKQKVMLNFLRGYLQASKTNRQMPTAKNLPRYVAG